MANKTIKIDEMTGLEAMSLMGIEDRNLKVIEQRFDKEITGGEERYHHLVLLAENNVGYSNLMKIVSKGFTEGFKRSYKRSEKL